MERELVEMACGRAVLAAEDYPTPERHAADVADRARWMGSDDDGACWAVEVFRDKIRALGVAVKVALMAVSVGCDEGTPLSSDASVMVDGSMCEAEAPGGPELYEIDLIPDESDCAPLTARVRRLDGPSASGACMSMASYDAGTYSIDFEEEREIDGVEMRISAVLEGDPETMWWAGTADVTRETVGWDSGEEDPEACAGSYLVEIERVR